MKFGHRYCDFSVEPRGRSAEDIMVRTTCDGCGWRSAYMHPDWLEDEQNSHVLSGHCATCEAPLTEADRAKNADDALEQTGGLACVRCMERAIQYVAEFLTRSRP